MAAETVTRPKLVDFKWRVDNKMASNSPGDGNVTCLMQLTVEETPDVNTVTLELTKEKVDMLLDGVNRIRDQLVSLSSK